MLLMLEKSFILLCNFRTYFLPLSHLQASFSNLLSRVLNRGPHFFGSIFYEVFGGTGLILPEAPRKLAIFTNKNIKKIVKKCRF